jgi:hypothetical protein
MRSQVHDLPVARIYWRMVMRWPVVQLLCLGFCFAIGIGGAIGLFDEPPAGLLLRVVGVLMLLCNGRWLVAFAVKFIRGTWTSHCEAKIEEAGGDVDNPQRDLRALWLLIPNSWCVARKHPWWSLSGLVWIPGTMAHMIYTYAGLAPERVFDGGKVAAMMCATFFSLSLWFILKAIIHHDEWKYH